MNIMIVTDAWEPQVNGVVRTLKQTMYELKKMGHTIDMITPLEFKTIPCPTYPDISLSLFPKNKVRQKMEDFAPDAIHIATEGPLGIAARAYALKHKLPFSTAYHTRFPEYVKARTGIPLALTYKFLRWFHDPSLAVMAPTQVVIDDLESYGFTNVVLWTRGVDLEIFKAQESEKNIEAFLELKLPGSKWVVGDGPALNSLKAKYPEVHYLGVLQQEKLAKVYAAADVFVFPSKTDTFGLVLLEAMACGTPVAAYPVTGPIDVIGNSQSGAMNDDLREACLEALKIPREVARAHAEKFSWQVASGQFLSYLKPIESHTTVKSPSLA
jgi:glycosyltransferase involved in cell wall biosynthesis